MPLHRGLADINDCINEGRHWISSFRKLTVVSGGIANYWNDFTQSAGHPVYNAKVGTPLTFTPSSPVANQSIWFPSINAGQDRYILNVILTGNLSGTTLNYIVGDTLGWYPFVDGDSIDVQTMDNTQTLPRYSDGHGVVPLLISNVAPPLNSGVGTWSYVDGEGNTVTNSPLYTSGTAKGVVHNANSTSASSPITLNSISGCGCGVRRVINVQWSTPPSGIFSLVLFRPYFMAKSVTPAANQAVSLEKQMLIHNGCRLPKVYDGAHIQILAMTSSNTAITSINGTMEFIWN